MRHACGGENVCRSDFGWISRIVYVILYHIFCGFATDFGEFFTEIYTEHGNFHVILRYIQTKRQKNSRVTRKMRFNNVKRPR